MDKQHLVTEGTAWLLEWLEKNDPDFKDASIIIMTTTKPKPGETGSIFDMASNEPPLGMLPMLLHGLNQALEGDSMKSVQIPRTKQ